METNKLHQDAVRYIVIHCSATPPEMDIGVKEIDRWHRQKGWFGCGYHFVINRDGELEHGRPVDRPGAHVHGYNHESIGVCLVGGVSQFDQSPEDNFTDAQYDQLDDLISRLQESYPKAKIVGHNELDQHKACPSFNVQEWMLVR